MIKMYKVKEREYYAVARKRHKITLKQIAKFIGVSDATVCRYENNKQELSPIQIKKYIYFIVNYEVDTN
jgi:transcriptional regulator with XRE-family HTH domain